MLRIRWRLLMGVISLVAAVAVSLPAAASTVDLGRRVADIWPNSESAVVDVVWPNSPSVMGEIWPNALVFGGGRDGSQDSTGNQNDQN